MQKLVSIVTIVLMLFSCQLNDSQKSNTSSSKVSNDSLEESPDISVVKQKEKFFVGDSVLTISFKSELDSSRYYKRSGSDSLDSLKEYKHGKFITIKAKIMASAGSFNGACKKQNDTLFLFFWHDTVICGRDNIPLILTFKIKKVKYKNIVLKRVWNKNEELDGSCL